MEGIAEETFGKIPNNDRPTPRYPALPFPTDDHRFLGKKINYKKKAPGHEIVIFFPINIKNHPSLGYVQYLLEHKGSGSIYQYLLTRGYITTSWNTQIPYEDLEKTSFSVVGGLTEKGVADPLFIVDAVFMYLKAASSNGVDIALWGAMNEIDKLKFRFQDKEHPPNLVYNLCKSMRETNDSRKYLKAPSQAHLDIALENNILKLLRPDNFNIYVGSDSFSDVEAAGNGPQLTKREYYYNTPYYDTNFTEEQLETWQNIEAHPELHLPDPNVLVAKNFQVFEIEEDAGEVPLEIVSRNEDDISIWWFQDKEWKKPKSLVYCKIYPSNVTRDAKTSALEMMLDATFGLIKDKAFYDAEEVSFSPDITLGKDWGVWLFGYSDPDKIEAVIIKMMDALLYKLNFQMDEAHYNATILKPTQRSLDEDDDTSILISFRYVSKIINENFVDPVDVIESAGRITQSDIKDYFDSFLKDVSVTCSAMGNVRKEHAIRYSHIIKNKLLEKGSAINDENRKALTEDLGIFKLPPGPSHVIRRRRKNPEAVTSAIIVFFQIGQTKSRGHDSDKPPYTLFALTELLGLIMGSRCFHYLRTEV